MKYYSQRNPRWKGQTLGTCRSNTIGSDGCLVTSVCNGVTKQILDPKGVLRDCEPWVLDWVATIKKMYSYGCYVNHQKFAEFLGLKYNGRAGANHKITYPTIACTMYYGFTHFVKIYPDGTIVDPLDGNALNNWTPKRKKNIKNGKVKYKFTSYRLYELEGKADCNQIEKDYQEAKKEYRRLKKLRCKK